MPDIQRSSVDEIVRHFEELEDPRSTINLQHPLVSVVVIALMAVLAGANGPTAIAKWATASAHSCAAWVVWRDGFGLDILDSVGSIG
jgi:hypothetical protein